MTLSDSGTMNEKEIVLNDGQRVALEKIGAFLKDEDSRVFILKGFAGTGKTTMIKKVISYMAVRQITCGLLASTGRAAKVLGDATGCPAGTIHGEIYRFGGFNSDLKKLKAGDDGRLADGVQLCIQFDLGHPDEMSPDVYIVDEASMISDREEKTVVQSRFGNGKLLTDLLRYDKKAKFIFVGDPCQLAPVTGEPSPALSPSYFREHFGIEAEETVLTEVMRQADGNGIVMAASEIRHLWECAPENELFYGRVNNWKKLPFRNVANIVLLDSVSTLTSRYLEEIRGGNYGKAIFICMSNNGCYNFSLKFREELGYSGQLQKNELVLVVQNNLISGFRNGDLLRVLNVSPVTEKRADLTFREVEVQELYTEKKFKQLMIDDILYQPQVNLDSDRQSRLYFDFIMRMRKKGIPEKSEAFKSFMMSDKYLNALRVSFGYALTCHKSQGGEWPDVYAYFPRNIMLNPTKQKYQWVYTAMTRAKENFFVADDIYIEGYHYGFGH